MSKLDQLLGRTAAGDMEAFAELYRETARAVFAVVLPILRDRQLAEDAMQSAFIRIRDNASKYRPGTNAKAWILTVAKNLALNVLARRKREVFVDFAENESLYGEYCVEEQFADKLVLKTALTALREEERRIVLMYSAGLKHREIARQMELPLGTVTWKYNTAIKKLRKLMGDEEVSRP